MQKLIVLLSVLIVLPGLAWTFSSVPSGDNKVQVAQMSMELKSAEGELSRVDTKSQMIWIKADNGKEMQFSYTDQTIVEGTGGTVEGLADMSGTFLKIQYTTQGSRNVAIEIQVEPKQG